VQHLGIFIMTRVVDMDQVTITYQFYIYRLKTVVSLSKAPGVQFGCVFMTFTCVAKTNLDSLVGTSISTFIVSDIYWRCNLPIFELSAYFTYIYYVPISISTL